MLLLVAVIVRGGVLWLMRGSMQEDPDSYREIAENFLRTSTFARKTMRVWGPTPLEPTAYRPPLYPLLLANYVHRGEITSLRVGMLHWGLGVATVLLTFRLARMWQLNQWPAFLAALLIACDPILLRQSTLVMTETLATFLSVATLLALTRLSDRREPFNAALAGGAAAMCVLCRPTFYPWLAMIAIAIPFLAGSALRRIGNLTVFAFCAAVMITPWVIRNQIELGRPILATTHGGYTLALGNNRHFYHHLREAEWGEVWDAQASPLRKEIWNEFRTSAVHYEVDLDRAAYRVAMNSIREQPDMFLWSSLVRVGRLWSPLPHRITQDESTMTMLSRYAVALWYVGVFALAVLGVFQLRMKLLRTPWLWGVMLCVAFTAVHLLFWSNMRMRAPLMPVVALAAAVGTTGFGGRSGKS